MVKVERDEAAMLLVSLPLSQCHPANIFDILQLSI